MCTLVQALRLCTGRTAHRGSRGIALPFHDHGTRRGEGSASRPGRSLPPGKTRYPLYRRLGGPQGQSGQIRKISPPPGFDSRTVHSVASRYTDWATWPSFNCWLVINSSFIRDIIIDFSWSKTRSVIQSSEGSRLWTAFQYFIITVASCLEIMLISMLVFRTAVCDLKLILRTVCHASWKVQTSGKIVKQSTACY